MDEITELKAQIEMLQYQLDTAYRITKIYEDYILEKCGKKEFNNLMRNTMLEMITHDMNESPELEKVLNEVYGIGLNGLNGLEYIDPNEDFDEDDDEDSI